MTIEAKIDALIAALNANTNALTGARADAPQPVPATKPAAKAPKGPAANDGEPQAPTEPLNYERDVKAPMMALANVKGRDVVTPIFAEFKVKKATELTTEQWPAFIAAVAKAAA